MQWKPNDKAKISIETKINWNAVILPKNAREKTSLKDFFLHKLESSHNWWDSWKQVFDFIYLFF